MFLSKYREINPPKKLIKDQTEAYSGKKIQNLNSLGR